MDRAGRPCDIYVDEDEVFYVPELDGFMSILSVEVISSPAGTALLMLVGVTGVTLLGDSHGDL
ncbi:MAG: hypothetical protein CM1200mP27_13650 [Chloroflexota bacterium]|nr:MAG: hypothetical protein CM1200mP27_13650 [Chloroflexota bacterium]